PRTPRRRVPRDFGPRPGSSPPCGSPAVRASAFHVPRRSSASGGKKSKDQSDSKSDADGLVGVRANISVRGFGARHGAFLQSVLGFLGDFERRREFLARRRSSFTEFVRAGSQQFLAVTHNFLQVLE